MGKKKLPSVADAVKHFKDASLRATLSTYYHVNGILVSINKDGHRIVLVPESELLTELWKDESVDIKELDITSEEGERVRHCFYFGENHDKDWHLIESTSDMYAGKILKIRIKEREYPVELNRQLLPLKLRKAEYTDISYKIFCEKSKGNIDQLILALQKRFVICDNCNFSMIKLLQII